MKLSLRVSGVLSVPEADEAVLRAAAEPHRGVHDRERWPVNDDHRQILKGDGSCCYDPAASDDGSVDATKEQVVVAHFHGVDFVAPRAAKVGRGPWERRIRIKVRQESIRRQIRILLHGPVFRGGSLNRRETKTDP